MRFYLYFDKEKDRNVLKGDAAAAFECLATRSPNLEPIGLPLRTNYFVAEHAGTLVLSVQQFD